MRTLALVESPAQLLNLLEWVRNPAAPVDPAEVAAAVLQPTDFATRAQLAAVTALARADGVAVTTHEARGTLLDRAGSGARLTARLVRARRLVLGDPFSRLVQTLLPSARSVRDVTVVDDGTATMEFAALLAGGRPLVRWHSTGPVPAAAVRAARLLDPALRRLEVFSSLPLPALPGAELTVNQYAWTRARFGPPEVTGGADLIGTSLVETGVVSADAYLRQVEELVAAYGVRRYFAHRREAADKLTALRDRTGVAVVRPELPLELHARTGPIARTVLSFPSTLVHTLPQVLADTGVRVLVSEVDAGALTVGHTEGRAARFLADVIGTARRRHGLEAAAP